MRSLNRRPIVPTILAVIAIVLSLQPYTEHSSFAAGAGTMTPSATIRPSATVTPVTQGIPDPTIPVPAAPVPTRTPTPGPPTATSTATATSTGIPTATATMAATPAQETAPPRHYVVLIVIDAMRPMYFSYTKLPHIQQLMQHGVVYDRAYVGEMESSTPGVHVTLGTGTLPKENGFLGFGWALPHTRKWVDFRTLLADGQIDPVLRSLSVPTVAARLHQFIPHSVAIAASGHKDYAAVGLGGGAADYVLYGKFAGNQFIPDFLHSPPPLTPAERASLMMKSPLPMGQEDAWAFRYASIVARHVTPRLLMLNVPETDTWGHWYGPNDRQVFSLLLKNIDRGIGEIEDTYRALGILSRTDFIITGDHGMMESIAAENWKPLQSDIRAAGAQVARADGSGGGIWLQNPAQAEPVAHRLVSMNPAHVEAIFYRSGPGNNYEYIQASPMSWLVNPQVGAALQRLVDTTAGIHGPDLWVLYRENYTVDSNNVSGKWKGTHGGATWKVQHVPLIISGPGIRQGVHSQFPARSMDIAPTMERLLGLPYIKRDGVILADAFTQPLPGELKPEQMLEPELGADVAALRAQSLADDAVTHWPRPGPIYRCGNKKDPNCQVTPSNDTNQ